MEDKRAREEVLYKDILCEVFTDSNGKYLMIKNSCDLNKSIKYGFKENAFGKHCLYVYSCDDFQRTNHIYYGYILGYFNVSNKKIYAVEIWTGACNIPVFYQLTEEAYESKIFDENEKRPFYDGYRDSGENYFSQYDVYAEINCPCGNKWRLDESKIPVGEKYETACPKCGMFHIRKKS